MKCGFIYAITNKINGKMYIGKTTKKSFDERYGGDIRNTHNTHLRNSIEKYGIENFAIDKCICECETKESLNEAEKFYIDYFNTANSAHGYNKTLGGDGGISNEETRKKISKANSGEKNPMYGKNAEDYMTPEAIKIKRERLSKANKEAWTDPERIKKQSEKFSGENNPSAKSIIQLDKEGNFIRKWDYMKQASKELNISHISEVCSGRYKSAGGYKWMYEDDYLDLLQYAF